MCLYNGASAVQYNTYTHLAGSHNVLFTLDCGFMTILSTVLEGRFPNCSLRGTLDRITLGLIILRTFCIFFFLSVLGSS